MHTVTVSKIFTIDNDRLIVTGAVDGVSVRAEGSTGRVTNAKSDAHKARYVESLLLAAAPLAATDSKMKGHVWRNVWIWIQCHWKTVAVSVTITEILRHLKW